MQLEESSRSLPAQTLLVAAAEVVDPAPGLAEAEPAPAVMAAAAAAVSAVARQTRVAGSSPCRRI
jgi:hypothetical protein